MKKEEERDTDNMRDEYHFDYSKAEWGKFAGKIKRSGARVVTIEAAIAKVFPDSASVNEALRKVIAIGKLVVKKDAVPRKPRASKATAKSSRVTTA